MGKVKRLRKKYHALCANSKKAEAAASTQIASQSSIPSLTYADLISSSKANRNKDCELRSTFSISKSIKSALSGQSIAKKDKRRLRHNLFLNKLESTAVAFSKSNTTMKKCKTGKGKIGQDNPMKVDVNDEEMPSLEKLPASTDDSLKWSKGALKRRNKQLVQDINLFKNLMKDTSLLDNPHGKIQEQTLTKLNDECLQSQVS